MLLSFPSAVASVRAPVWPRMRICSRRSASASFDHGDLFQLRAFGLFEAGIGLAGVARTQARQLAHQARAFEAQIRHGAVEERRAHDLGVGGVDRGRAVACLQRGEGCAHLGQPRVERVDLGDLLHMGARDGADAVFAADLQLVARSMSSRSTSSTRGCAARPAGRRSAPPPSRRSAPCRRPRPPPACRLRRQLRGSRVVSTIRLSERRISIDPVRSETEMSAARSGCSSARISSARAITGCEAT
jgi:hypothetical protein